MTFIFYQQYIILQTNLRSFSELKAAAQVDNWYCLICKMERVEGQKWTKLQLQRAREGMSKLALFRSVSILPLFPRRYLIRVIDVPF